MSEQQLRGNGWQVRLHRGFPQPARPPNHQVQHTVASCMGAALQLNTSHPARPGWCAGVQHNSPSLSSLATVPDSFNFSMRARVAATGSKAHQWGEQVHTTVSVSRRVRPVQQDAGCWQASPERRAADHSPTPTTNSNAKHQQRSPPSCLPIRLTIPTAARAAAAAAASRRLCHGGAAACALGDVVRVVLRLVVRVGPVETSGQRMKRGDEKMMLCCTMETQPRLHIIRHAPNTTAASMVPSISPVVICKTSPCPCRSHPCSPLCPHPPSPAAQAAAATAEAAAPQLQAACCVRHAPKRAAAGARKRAGAHLVRRHAAVLGAVGFGL